MSQCIVSVQLLAHLFLTFLVECHVIKFNHFNVTLSNSTFTLFQMLMEGLEPPTHHQFVKSQTIHRWFCPHIAPIEVVANRNDRVEQVPREHFLHTRVPRLPSRPILPLSIKEIKDQVDHKLQVTRLGEAPDLDSSRQHVAYRHARLLVSEHPILVHSITRLFESQLSSSRHMHSTTRQLSQRHLHKCSYTGQQQSDSPKRLSSFIGFQSTNQNARNRHVVKSTTRGMGGYPPFLRPPGTGPQSWETGVQCRRSYKRRVAWLTRHLLISDQTLSQSHGEQTRWVAQWI